VQLGRLVFSIRNADGLAGSPVEVNQVVFVTDEPTVVHIAAEGAQTSFDDVSEIRTPFAPPKLSMPNPLQPGSAVSFELTENGHVSIAIYSVGGQKVRDIAAGSFSSGHHERVWDGRTDAGQEAAPGIYYVRAVLGRHKICRTIALVR
jgi:hypothetical protein